MLGRRVRPLWGNARILESLSLATYPLLLCYCAIRTAPVPHWRLQLRQAGLTVARPTFVGRPTQRPGRTA